MNVWKWKSHVTIDAIRLNKYTAGKYLRATTVLDHMFKGILVTSLDMLVKYFEFNMSNESQGQRFRWNCEGKSADCVMVSERDKGINNYD